MPAVGLIPAEIERRRRRGGSATSNAPLAPPTGSSGFPSGSVAPAAPAAYPSSVAPASGYAPPTTSQLAAPSTVPLANAITPRRVAALTPSALGAAKPKPRVRQQQSLLDELDRPFAPGETLTPKEAALLAEAYGLPGKTYAQIAKGESTLQPGAESNDGGMGLWQMTPRVQSPETVAKWEQIASQHKGGYFNPVANAKMAAYLAQGGTGVSNYYGTGFVTDPNAHLKGGPQRAQKALGMPASGGSSGPRQLSTSELFYDPGISLSDNQPTAAIGGHDTHVHFGSTDPRSILTAAKIAERKGGTFSENPLFDQVDPVHTTGSMHYESQQLPQKLVPLARKLGGTGRQIGEAIDIQGDPSELMAIDKALARRSGAPISGVPDSSSTLALGSTGATSGGVAAPGSVVPPAGPTGPAASRQRASTLQDLLGSVSAPRQSSLSQSPLSPRTRLSRDDQQQQDEEQQTLYDLLYGNSY